MAINTKKFASVVQDTLAENYGIFENKKNCEFYVNAVLDSIVACLGANEDIKFTGFGSFVIKERPGRECINPQTKESMWVDPIKYTSFKAGKALKDAVRGDSQ